MKQRMAGFTFLELLLVIAIIGVMSTFAVIGLTGAQAKARDSKRKSDLETIRGALELYKSDCDRYPPANAGAGNFSFANSNLTGSSAVVGARCATTNTYLNSMPKDPLTGPAYTYGVNATGSTYSLCATLEQHGGMASVSCGATGTVCGASYTCYYQAINP